MFINLHDHWYLVLQMCYRLLYDTSYVSAVLQAFKGDHIEAMQVQEANPPRGRVDGQQWYGETNKYH